MVSVFIYFHFCFPLINIFLQGDKLRVTRLLDAGADPNTTDYDGRSAMVKFGFVKFCLIYFFL